jgi:hypothetical protein
MKKVIILFLALLLSPTFSFASFNDVTLTTSTTISVGGYTLNVTGSSAVIQSIIINDGNFSVVLSAGSSIQITSPTYQQLTTDVNTFTTGNNCATNSSVLTLSSSGSTGTVTITPTATICSTNPVSTSAPVSSGGSGSPAMWTLPTVPNGGYKMNINGGALTTSNRNVILGFNAGMDIKKVAISMTGNFTDASQEDYSASKQWNLCSKFGGSIKNPTCPDGTYKVYAQFYTAYGRSSAAAIASSTITLKSSATAQNLQQTNNPLPTKSFTKYLQYRQTNNDIKRLQIFLNSDPDTKIANSGTGSPGKETNYFGLLTYKAVIRFQEKYAKDVLAPSGLKKGTGYVGKTTLNKINELIKQ